MQIEDTQRSNRRHHTERLKKARQFYWGRWLADSPRSLGQVVTTPKPNKGWMDGNPRKYSKELTVGERSSVESFQRIEIAN